jgi:hypothetical protein
MLHVEFCSEFDVVSRGPDAMGLSVKCARRRSCATSHSVNIIKVFTYSKTRVLWLKTSKLVAHDYSSAHRRINAPKCSK